MGGFNVKYQTFNQWLRENYSRKNHRFNDLLNDTAGDKNYPWRRGYEAQMRYLIEQNACSDCLETLRDAYFDYLTEG